MDMASKWTDARHLDVKFESVCDFLSDSLRFETKFVDAEFYLDNEFGEFRL